MKESSMNMQMADIVFIRFEAEDVIATSGNINPPTPPTSMSEGGLSNGEGYKIGLGFGFGNPSL